MNEKFEKYIENNREAFDQIESPDIDQFWNEFNQQPASKKTVRLWHILSMAASVLLIIALFFFTTKESSSANNKEWVIQQFEQSDPYVAEYQSMLVSTMYKQDSLIKSLNVIPGEHQDIYQSLADIEQTEKEYMADLVKNGSDQKIILALFKCAKQRIRLYELILHQIDLQDYHEKLEHKIEI